MARTVATSPAVSVATLGRLLHIKRGKPQRDGRYSGALFSLSDTHLKAHLQGDDAFAFSVVDDTLANFACIDVDEDFARRLHILRDAVDAVGGEPMLHASFATTGSDDGRGKVVVTVARPTDASLMQRIIAAIRKRATNDQRFGIPAPGSITTFPQDSSGGIVRVLGRNIGRGGSLDKALSLEGEVIDLANVIPLDAARIFEVAGSLQTHRVATRATWCDKLLIEPWQRSECGGNRGAFRRLVAIARETIRLRGYGDDGRVIFKSWVEDVCANSPDFRRASDKNRDRRNPLAWDRGGSNAWRIACENPTTFRPRSLDGIASSEQRRVYAALADHVIANGLNSACFGLDYERIRELSDIDDKRNARRAIYALVNRGFVDVVDHGAPRESGRRGLMSLWALVGDGETVEALRTRREADVRSSQRMRRRAQEHLEREGRTGMTKIEI